MHRYLAYSYSLVSQFAQYCGAEWLECIILTVLLPSVHIIEVNFLFKSAWEILKSRVLVKKSEIGCLFV